MTGSIKDYTPNFEFIIPEFNITGWHDYLEENFRSIDALFYNLFGINNFKGQWKNSTVYNVDDVVFIGEDTDYSGRLVKVLVQHTTAGTGNFTEFFTANPSYYELFADASSAQIFAQEAKDWAVKLDGPVEDDLYSSKFYANIVNDLSTEITTLYNIRSDIQNVSLIGTEVVNVSNIKNSVQTVANNTTNINTVANNSSNINTVAGNSANINSVAGNSTNINSVANNIINIDTVASNTTNINTTATNISNININATNINAINTNASNISAIQNAYSNAQSALNSKNLAQEWAISEDIVDNTDYSAKHYAEIAQTYGHPLYIGQIIESTIPLTDAGLHLLDGALIQGDGIYSDFYDYIVSLYNDYPQIFADEQGWQQDVSNFGVCGKFVFNTTNRTVRLPLIKGFIEGTNDLSVLDHMNPAGLPNITSGDAKVLSWKNDTQFSWTEGALQSNETPHGGLSDSTGLWAGSVAANFNASRSSPIYGRSNTVQPQSIKVLYYIVIATSTKTDIQVDIDEIVTDLNNKLDKNDLAPVHCVVETYQNGTSWYRVYDDGWCEQGGRGALNETSTTTITLLKPYKDTNYSVSAVSITASTAQDTEAGLHCTPISTTQITLTAHYLTPNSQIACWQAYGYIS